jgi:transcriptional regulator with PAS, ATPase and Fis domain
VNGLMQEMFATVASLATGKPFGYAFGCLDAVEGPVECGFNSDCQICAIRDLAASAILENRKQKTQTTLVVSTHGQVRDIPLIIRVLPFSFAEQKFAVLIIEPLKSTETVKAMENKEGYRGIIGQSVVMRDLFETIRQIAQTDAPVLIQGETGTGKELVALALHKESLRFRNNFVPINCGALPEGLLESELFGHLKGAFTGADGHKKGRFAVADNGTLFLDEVGELSPAIQVKFLRVLQNGCFEAVGSDRTTCVDVRVISATNARLDQQAAQGRFRQDLYYRLSVMPITVPPLRARKEDIPLLCNHFLAEFRNYSWTHPTTLSPEVERILMDYSWPGNVRELRNVLQYASVRATSEIIAPADLPPILNPSEFIDMHYKRKQNLKLSASRVAEALRMANGNRRQAAKILGVSRSTLYRFFDNHAKVQS